ncbi:hypothetical protein DFO77_11616 [Marinilabilia salmonicolor]|uniref:Uncharacterized protein n=1 Tax=Marinilabilia salmonicolor TaxID=989 RepID=A0A368UT14_9BACT|nr:hypothetical protein DFO77_11616 [Marinilabilia salmonicolor]
MSLWPKLWEKVIELIQSLIQMNGYQLVEFEDKVMFKASIGLGLSQYDRCYY